MNIEPVNTDATLYAVKNVFPDYIEEEIRKINWHELPVEPMILDRHRQTLRLPASLNLLIRQHLLNIVNPQIEETAKIKFLDPEIFHPTCWLCQPGYHSRIHIDGTIPATMQVYWYPTDRSDMGTYFYNSKNVDDVSHYFPNDWNTGYLSFPKMAGQPLWHGTDRPLEKDILRVCFMIVYGDFESQR